MKACFCVLLSLFLVISARAQDDSDQLPIDGNGKKYSPARLYGKVIVS